MNPSLSNTTLIKLLVVAVVVLTPLLLVSDATFEPASQTGQVVQAVSADVKRDIQINDQVQAAYRLVVRDAMEGRKFGTQHIGKVGTVLLGPEEMSGVIWWYVDWESSTVDGWTEEGYLENMYTPLLFVTADQQTVAFGKSARIDWNARHVAACIMRGPGVDMMGVRGSAETSGLMADSRYTLLCTTAEGGKAIHSILIRVSLPSSAAAAATWGW